MVKKVFLAATLASVFFACGGDQATEEITTDLINNPTTASGEVTEDNAPIFEFDSKVVEFGQITQGEIVSKVFKFRNVGKTNLIISSAQGSCGCTIPKWPKEPIKPGESSQIDVKFDSNGKHGMQNKTITLVANTIPNTMVIALKGEVLTPETK